MFISYKKKKLSLLLDFSMISAAILVVFVILITSLFTRSLDAKSKTITQMLDSKGDKISRMFNDIIDFTSHEMAYLGRQIIADQHNIGYMKSLFGSFRSRQDDVFSWSTFMWSNDKYQVTVTNNFGILGKTKDLAMRDYIPKTKLFPWQIHTGKPVFGAVSNQWIIPAGFGVTDKKGKYIGAVITGLNINKLILKLENTLQTDEMSFAILDEELNIIAESSNNQSILKENGIIDEIKKIDVQTGHGLLTRKHLFLNGYGYYHHLKEYPYIILTSYNKNISNSYIFNTILLGASQTGLIIIILFGILLFLYKRVITPIVRLSDSANSLAKGKYTIQIPRGGPYEVHILAKQLVNIQRYIKKINRIESDLRLAKYIAEDASAAKSQFLANMSHELRTPMNSILGYSEMIKLQIVNKEVYAEYAGYINSSGKHLLALIDDMMDIAKTEAGHFAIYEAKFDPTATIHESIAILTPQATASGVTIKLEAPDNLPKILGDEVRIKQVILNIMSNAIKFSHKNGVVTLQIKADNTGFYIIAHDTGIGIAPEDMAKALEKFGQGNSDIRKKSEGSGLGLWIVKSIIEAHGGTISLASTPNVGTSVTVHLPPERVIL